MTNEEKTTEADKAAALLAELFDHVQILVSWNNGDSTFDYAVGQGNWFARQGLAHAFVNRDVAQVNAREIGEALG